MKVFLSLCLFLGSFAAWADPTPAPSPTPAPAPEIVVTATREPSEAQTLPVGVTVIDGDALSQSSSVSDALGTTLSVRLSTLTPGQPTLEAPGFGDNGFGRMALLVDGFVQNNPDLSAPPLDLVPVFALDRIEVLNGPGSALYGDGAVAGAVNLVTKVPRKLELEGDVSVEWTGSNRQSLAFGLPLGDGGLLVSAQRTQGLPVRERSDSDQEQAYLKYDTPLARGGVDQDLDLWGSVSRTYCQLPGGLTQAQYDADPNQAVNPADSGTVTETKGGGAWTGTGTGWSMTVPLSATYRLVRSQYPSYYPPVYDQTGLWVLDFEPRVSADLGTWAQATWGWNGGLGAYWARFAVDQYPGSGFSNPGFEALVQRGTGSVWSRLQGSWDNRWYLSAAARIEGSLTTAHSDQQPGINGNLTYWPLSGSVGVTWLPGAGAKVGAEVSRVFRYPATDEMVSYEGFWPYAFNKGIDPEVGHGLTLTGSWKQGAADLSVSGTVLRMENEVVMGNQENINGGPTWHGTFLADAAWSPVSWGSAGVEYGYELARFASGDNSGKVVPLVPSHRGRVYLRASWDRIGELTADWTGSSSYYTSGDLGNTQTQVPSSQSLGFGVTVPLGTPELTLRFYGKNLTDDRTPSYVNSYIDPANPAWDSTTLYPSEGRILGVSLGWKS